MSQRVNRRDFVKAAGLAGANFWIASNATFADSKSPNEKLNLGIIGAGGRGGDNLTFLASQNIVALCDVDEQRAAKAFTRYPRVAKYHDFRKMLEDRKDIDAVVVSTPDHTHAAAGVMAMKLGKHVYCEKPLTHSIYEARVMRETAATQKVATQMGNLGASSARLRRGAEMIQAGVIGHVRDVHVWTNRPSSWPQGLDRPHDTPPVPKHLDWDLWLGPAADRPYHPAYVPFKWRGWWDFGTGALGDMACHTVNLPFLALKLAFPSSVEAESSGIKPDSAPKWSIIRFDYPTRGELPAVKLTWYDGGKKPPQELAKGLKKPLEKSGCLMIGDKGILYSPGDYGTSFQLLPEGDFADAEKVPETIPRSPGHYQEWILACKGGSPAMMNFDRAAVLTESILLGNVALRVGKKIEWDAVGMKAAGCPEADAFVRTEYRKGWTL